jgi:excisionase family DNA binding protein
MNNTFVFTEVETIEKIVSEKVAEAVKKAFYALPIHQEKESKILNFKQACEFLGISQSHGYKLTSQNKIPHSKRGKRLFFERDVLEGWLLENRVKTCEQIMDEVTIPQPRKRKGQRY